MEMRGIVALLWFSLVTLLSVSGNGGASTSTSTYTNKEVKVLSQLKNNLKDPNGVLQSWDSTLANPCTWLHVTCNNHNRVVRLDLGNANLSGKLVPQLGQLKELQYLEIYSNNIWGRIPAELGQLKKLVSLDLYSNNLRGPIPPTLGNLQKLRFLRLNNNSLTGEIPLSLTTITTLQVLDVSYNNLFGFIPTNGSFAMFTYMSFAGNPHLVYPPWASPPPSIPMAMAPSPSPRFGAR